MGNRKTSIRIRQKDQDRIDIIRGVFDEDMSVTKVLRMGLIALCRQLGFEKEVPTDLLKNNNTTK